MNKLLKFRCPGLFVISTFLLLLPFNVYAADHINPYITVAESYTVAPRAEETGYIYKIMNGKQYKRLWSYTYAKWIDANWFLA